MHPALHSLSLSLGHYQQNDFRNQTIIQKEINRERERKRTTLHAKFMHIHDMHNGIHTTIYTNNHVTWGFYVSELSQYILDFSGRTRQKRYGNRFQLYAQNNKFCLFKLYVCVWWQFVFVFFIFLRPSWALSLMAICSLGNNTRGLVVTSKTTMSKSQTF